MQTSVYRPDAPRTGRSGGRSSHRAPSKVIREQARKARYPASQKTGKQHTNTPEHTRTGYHQTPDHRTPDPLRLQSRRPARYQHDTSQTPVISRGVRFKSESPHQSQSRTGRCTHVSHPPCILEEWKKMGENRRSGGHTCTRPR